MIDMPPVEIVEMVQEPSNEESIKKYSPHMLGRPNCPHPSKGVLDVGSVKIFDGWITLTNETEKQLNISMKFTLPRGYLLKIIDNNDNQLLEEYVKINKSYEILQSGEDIYLNQLD